MTPAPAGLAAAADPSLWPPARELLFVGGWCAVPGNAAARAARPWRLLASPWGRPGAAEEALSEYDRVEAALLAQLADRLGRRRGIARSERWWRIVLGPWLMAWLTALQDRLLHARAAAAAAPGALAARCGPPAPPPRDTAELVRWLPGDAYNARLFSELFADLGLPCVDRPAPPLPAPAPRPAWKAAAAGLADAALGAGPLAGAPALFSSLYLPRAAQARLVWAARGRAAPLGLRLPEPPPPDPGNPLRREAPGPVDGSPLARAAAALLPGHLPRLFAEGLPAALSAAARRPRPPRVLLTSVGWQGDEAFKLLAAESVERGGRLVIAQHGGAYGLHETLHSERHERAVADEWWSWGWEEPSDARRPARLRPMPNPRLRALAPRAGARGILLVTHALPRGSYMFYYCNVPAWSRYEEHLAARGRFAAALPAPARAALSVRLPVHDGGWGMRERLEEACPGLRCEEARGPLAERAREACVCVVDHPQTSALELMASGLPVILFWDPALWPERAAARPWLDGLRREGLLHDAPEPAALEAARALEDPAAWSARPGRRAAAEAFRGRFARPGSGWAQAWAGRLEALAAEARA